MLAAIIDRPANVGYAAVFAPIAHDGQMSIVVLVALAAAAASIALGIYFLGRVAEEVISTAGPAAAVAGVPALAGFLDWRHRRAAA